jgi:hypothetical protein
MFLYIYNPEEQPRVDCHLQGQTQSFIVILLSFTITPLNLFIDYDVSWEKMGRYVVFAIACG